MIVRQIKTLTKLGCVLSIIVTALMLQGCIVAAVGLGVGAVKWANAQKREAELKCNDAYNRYLTVMLENHKKPVSLHDYCSNAQAS